jgi:AcrR family transcriptional regulator
VAKAKGATPDPPPRRTRLAGPERRAVIVAAAREVFMSDGYGGARTRAIAERAGVTEAVLYRHFDSKEEIFTSAILTPLAEGLDALLERTRAALSPDAPVEARLAALETVWLEGLAELLPLLGVALFSDQETGRACYRSTISPFLDAMLGVMSGAGLVNGGRDGWTVVRAAFGMNMLLVIDAAHRRGGADTAGLVAQLTDLYYFGLGGGRSLRLG